MPVDAIVKVALGLAAIAAVVGIIVWMIRRLMAGAEQLAHREDADAHAEAQAEAAKQGEKYDASGGLAGGVLRARAARVKRLLDASASKRDV